MLLDDDDEPFNGSIWWFWEWDVIILAMLQVTNVSQYVLLKSQ